MIIFELKDIATIKDGFGVRFNILAKLENIRQSIHIDIAANDPITPSVIENSYKTIINNQEILLNTCPYETISAEKYKLLYHWGQLAVEQKIYLIYSSSRKDLVIRSIKIMLN